ncbi:MAG: hypothetical protein JXR95_14620 [Deltaproteobacteria bacterium]|nr:hypothetical protein [Deltaproteobacteria bacterium]
MRLFPVVLIGIYTTSCFFTKTSNSEREKYIEYQLSLARERAKKQKEDQKRLQQQKIQQDQQKKIQFENQYRNHLAQKAAGVLSSSRNAFGDTDLYFLSWNYSYSQLNLSNTAVTDEGLVYLRGIKSLQTLYLNSTAVTDKGLKHVGSMNNLRVLYLDGTNITDNGLKHLKNLRSLYQIYITNTKIRGIGLRYLKNLSISTLNLHGKYFDDSALKGVSELKKLFYLSIVGTSITGEGLKYLKNALTLSTIHLAKLSVKEEYLRYFPDIPSLKTISFDESIPPSIFKYIAQLKITSFSFPPAGVQPDDKILGMLAASKTINTLYIIGDKYTDKGLSYIFRMKNLRKVIISGKMPGQRALHFLWKSKLEKVYLSKNAPISGYASNSTIKSFTALKVAVTPSVIGTLKGLKKLEHLNLGIKGLDIKLISHFSKLKHLKSLSITCLDPKYVKDDEVNMFRSKLSEVLYNTRIYLNCYKSRYRRYPIDRAPSKAK